MFNPFEINLKPYIILAGENMVSPLQIHDHHYIKQFWENMSHDFPYRQTIRLPGYDYTRNGLYFVTICTQNRENLFGDIVGAKPCFRPTHAQNCPTKPKVPNALNIPTNTKFEPNISGTMIEKWWLKLFEKFPELKLHQYVLMPNHFHGIIEICDKIILFNKKTKTDILEFETNCQNKNSSGIDSDENRNIIPAKKQTIIQGGNQTVKSDENMVSPLQGLGCYISWFKRMTTNEYIRMVKEKLLPPFYGKIWQRNYHEHIIRNEKSYQIIAEYININPQKWESDSLYKS